MTLSVRVQDAIYNLTLDIATMGAKCSCTDAAIVIDALVDIDDRNDAHVAELERQLKHPILGRI